MSDNTTLARILLEGVLPPQKFDCFGQIVTFDLSGVGTDEEIAYKTNNLDAGSKKVVTDILQLAYALRSVGGYDFKESLDEKLKFIRSMKRPLLQLFLEELRSAEMRENESFAKRRDELKKRSPNQP